MPATCSVDLTTNNYHIKHSKSSHREIKDFLQINYWSVNVIGTNITMEMGNVTDNYDQYGYNYTDYYYDDEPLYRLQDHVSNRTFCK